MAEDVIMDGRKAEDILAWILETAPYYVPGLDASGDNAGAALLKIFSHIAEDVTKRLDQVPEKHFMAFLDTLGFGFNPPQPARVPIKFIVAEGALSDVYVPDGTQAVASANKKHTELTYEVESCCGFMATASSFIKIYSVDPNLDVIVEHLEAIGKGSYPEIFTGSPSLQEHILYIGHDDLFNVKSMVNIEIKIDPACIDPKYLTWEYYGEAVVNGKKEGEDGWRPLKIDKKQSQDDEITVINVRGIGPVFNQRLNSSGIYNVGQLLKLTQKQLASILQSSVQTAANIQESAEKALWDKVRVSSITPYIVPLVEPGHIILSKDIEGEIKEFELPLNKIKSRWIRCKYTGPKIEATVRSIKVAVKLDNQGAKGVKPDMALYNDIPLDLDKPAKKSFRPFLDLDKLANEPFRPFGDRPNLYDSFYIACNDVFSKRESTVKLNITIVDPTSLNPIMSKTDLEIIREVTNGISPILSWEYWNGKGWNVIPGCKDDTDNLKKAGTFNVSFTCPGDLEKVKVAGHENRWIRARLVGGDYGKPEFKNTNKTWIIDYSKIEAPVLSGIGISYRYQKQNQEQVYLPAQHLRTYNNLDYGGDFADSKLEFRPFEWLEPKQCLYLGFNKPLSGGPFNILFSMEEREYPESFMPRIRWEYKCAGGWKRVQASDGTNNLTRRGILSMIIPDDMEAAKAFGNELFWVRGLIISEQQFESETTVINRFLRKKTVSSNTALQTCEKPLNIDCNANGTGNYSPILKGIHLNTTWASHTETIKDELLGSSDGTAGQSYVFSRRPALEAEVWVNEISSITTAERKLLAAELPSGVRQDMDADGNLAGFWVKWSMADDFLSSVSGSRHYLLEQSTGRVIFGDGIHGKIPSTGKDNLKASYKTGGGNVGNIKAREISSLKSSLAFIEGACNPEVADGGMDLETEDQLKDRAPQHLKNRGRAVTKEDFERIALEMSRKIARARCIPNLNNECKRERGWVMLVIVPESGDEKPVPSEELKEQVLARLRECSSLVLMPRRVTVRGPTYLEVSITAKLISGSLAMVPAIENEAYTRLKKYLHPLKGGTDGKGWEFGRLPCLSDFYCIFEEIDGVDHVKELAMEVKGMKKGQKVVITPDSDQEYQIEPYCLAFGGDHDISVDFEVPNDDS